MTSRRPFLIAYVDDERADRDAFAATVGRFLPSHRVVGLETGEALLAYLADQSEERPGMVLIDLVLPGMSGFETARQVRAHAEFAEMPIVLVTASLDATHALTAQEVGAELYTAKPVTTDKLALMLEATRFELEIVGRRPRR